MSSLWIAVGFVAVWLLTFKPAWRVFIRLVVRVGEPDFRLTDRRFWLDFVWYRLIIFAPYMVPLVFAGQLPDFVGQLIWVWVGLGVVLSFGRIVGVNRLVAGLWQVYGFVYDGLLHFYPYRHLIDLVYERLDLRAGQSLLDVGCGTGNLLVRARAVKGVELMGVDSSSSMLARARRKLGGSARLERAELMTFLRRQPSRSSDRIALVNVAYTVKDRTALWRECLRLLKPEGSIVMTTSIAGGSAVMVQEHLRHDRWWRLLHPRLVLVGAVDLVINELSRSQVFEFPTSATLVKEIRQAGGRCGRVERCYGGPEKGVNIICTIRPE